MVEIYAKKSSVAWGIFGGIFGLIISIILLASGLIAAFFFMLFFSIICIYGSISDGSSVDKPHMIIDSDGIQYRGKAFLYWSNIQAINFFSESYGNVDSDYILVSIVNNTGNENIRLDVTYLDIEFAQLKCYINQYSGMR